MTNYVSTALPLGMIKKPGVNGAPLGYVAATQPQTPDLAAVSERLLSAGCSSRLVSSHLDYLYGPSNWKQGWLYADGVCSTINVRALRRSAFKAWFRGFMAKNLTAGKGNFDPNYRFMSDFGYSMTAKRAQYAETAFVLGEIKVKHRNVAEAYTFSPPASGVPDILDGLEAIVLWGTYDTNETFQSEYNFKWVDGTVWHIKAVSPYNTFIEKETIDAGNVQWTAPGATTDGTGPAQADIAAFADLKTLGAIPQDMSLSSFILTSGHTKLTGAAVTPILILPLSAHVKHVWWNTGLFNKATMPASLVASGRGALVTSSDLARTLDLALAHASDANAAAEVARLRASNANWLINFIDERPIRRKTSELALAREGDIASIESEQLVAPGVSADFPNGVTLKEVQGLLVDRSLKEGVTFKHMVVQSRDDFSQPVNLSVVVVVDYVNSAFQYAYPAGMDASDVLAVMSDGASVSFSPMPAATTALSTGAVKTATDRWALDNFGKTYTTLAGEAARLSREVTSLWDPAHYFDRFRPWQLVDVDKAELAFLLEVSGGFKARAMLISASESEAYGTYK